MGSAHVSYPASDPWVTACGGTILKNVAGKSFEEHTWNDKALELNQLLSTGRPAAASAPFSTYRFGRALARL